MPTSINELLYDKTVDRAVMIGRYEQLLKNKVFILLDDHKVRVEALVKAADKSEKGFRALRDAVDTELHRAYTQVYQVSKRSLLELAQDQLSYSYQVMKDAAGRVFNVKPASHRIAEDLVLKRGLAGDETLSEGWTRISASERRRLEEVMRKGISEGWSEARLTREVRRGNALRISKTHAEGLVTTAITSVQAQADHEVYAANSALLDGWQYVSVVDSKTTPVCRFRDGHIYPLGDVKHLPPAHFRCRATTAPVVKSWEALNKSDTLAGVRKRNLGKLTPKQRAWYDGQAARQEAYDDWLHRQPIETQLKHLGSAEAVNAFQSGKFLASAFGTASGKPIGIKRLRQLTDSEYTAPGDTARFARAKLELDMLKLPVARPEDLLDPVIQKRLRKYYQLQAGELDGTLSLLNYRGLTLASKKAQKRRVLTTPPKEEQLRFNPVTGRYEDVRLYYPAPHVLQNNLRLVDEAAELSQSDKTFIKDFVASLQDTMGVNEQAAIADNLRIIITRYRKNPSAWGNFKAVTQSQMPFDVMNVSDAVETHLRRDADLLKKLKVDNYIDPVLGPTQLDDLSREFFSNIRAKNRWEDVTAPRIAREMRPIFNAAIPLKLRPRISDANLNLFYEKFARRLALADTPDFDQLAVQLGRDLYNAANFNGSRMEWFELGKKLLESRGVEKLYKLETFGVQKRRMKSKMSGSYFGPYYDTLAMSVQIVDPRIRRYSQLTRKVEIGLRVAVTDPTKRLHFREGFKTYFIKNRWGLYEDTRIPITSTASFADFPTEFLDKKMVDALNWAAQAEYRVDPDFFDFINKLLNFEDDKGKAKYYNSLNEYRKYIASRGDSYERFKSMEWLRGTNAKFSNNAFVDHRARIYDRGLISPQSGETLNV
jgi:SPP1 gp7 family putative phage head morphogenesis protein